MFQKIKPKQKMATVEQVEEQLVEDQQVEEQPPNKNMGWVEWGDNAAVIRQDTNVWRIYTRQWGESLSRHVNAEEIIEFLIIDEDAPSDDENEEEEPVDVTPKKSKYAVLTLRMFIEKASNVADNVLHQMFQSKRWLTHVLPMA